MRSMGLRGAVTMAIYRDIADLVDQLRPRYIESKHPLTDAISIVGQTWRSLPYASRMGFAKRVLERIEKEHPRQRSLPRDEKKRRSAPWGRSSGEGS